MLVFPAVVAAHVKETACFFSLLLLLCSLLSRCHSNNITPQASQKPAANFFWSCAMGHMHRDQPLQKVFWASQVFLLAGQSVPYFCMCCFVYLQASSLPLFLDLGSFWHLDDIFSRGFSWPHSSPNLYFPGIFFHDFLNNLCLYHLFPH